MRKEWREQIFKIGESAEYIIRKGSELVVINPWLTVKCEKIDSN